jgi:hypothetical protein
VRLPAHQNGCANGYLANAMPVTSRNGFGAITRLAGPPARCGAKTLRSAELDLHRGFLRTHPAAPDDSWIRLSG